MCFPDTMDAVDSPPSGDRRKATVNLGAAEFTQGGFIPPEDFNKRGAHESEDFVGRCNSGTL